MSNEIAGPKLKVYIERAERLDREKSEIEEAHRELLAEVKGDGFDVTIFKEALKVRKQDPAARSEKASLLSLYLDAAG